jgi:hypothetical protein
MKNTKVLFGIIFMVVTISVGPFQSRAIAQSAQPVSVVGKWQVKFHLSDGVEKSLLFDSKPNGLGSFSLVNAKSGEKSETVAPAVWAEISNQRVSFSGHLELQLGTCCREIGTLIFKGRFTSNNSITGKLIFVTSVDEEESPYKFRSDVGAFTATRIP